MPVAEFRRQTRRALETGAAALVDHHHQWRNFDRLLTEDKDPGMFPVWNDGLQAPSAKSPTAPSRTSSASRAPAASAMLLTSNVSFINGELARLYGAVEALPLPEWAAPDGSAMRWQVSG